MTSQSKPHRIDVHHHIFAPKYLEERGTSHRWDAGMSLEAMDQAGIATAFTSITQPGIWFSEREQGRRLARWHNEFGAELVRDHPDRFGLFAAIPLPDTEGSLREIEYAFDVLKADGICLMTNFDDKWLGDPAYDEVFAEMNRRKALIYTHPTSCSWGKNLIPGIADGTIEWGTETTRAVTNILYTGTATRYPDIKYIWSHGGGTTPFLLRRITGHFGTDISKALPEGALPELRKFYYDTAQGCHPGAMDALRRMVPTSQIVFGTDFPMRPIMETVDALSEYDSFRPGDLEAIDRGNMMRILPETSRARIVQSA